MCKFISSKKHLIIFFLFTISFTITNKVKAQVNVQDSLALVDFYNSTNGSGWTNHTNWLSTAPVKNWYGVKLDVTNSKIREINLNNNNLVGNLANVFVIIFQNLELQILNLSSNHLQNGFGSTYPSILKSPYLETLELNNNFINDSIPEWFGYFYNLKRLNLSTTGLYGSPISRQGALPNSLKSVNLSVNNLTGNISYWIDILFDSIDSLNLASNTQLGGTISNRIGYMNSLKYLNLTTCNLSGGIPKSIGKLINLSLLDLSQNKISGSIPDSIGYMTQLAYLYLYSNQLNGSIPISMGNLLNLQEINFSLNNLSGNIPESFGNLANLRTFSLYDNNISGSIPASIGNLTNLKDLSLALNNLTGNIPSSFGNLSNLSSLFLINNQLSGPIPSSLNNLPTATFIAVADNKFTFSGIEQLLPAHINLTYSPQANITITESYKLLISSGGTLTNNTYKWYKDNTLVATITGDSTFAPSSFGKYSVAVTNAIATDLTLYSDTILASNISTTLCNPVGGTTLNSNISGTNYQWQISTDGIAFNNISNNSNYTGTNLASLQVNNIPSSFYGYQYRCVVDGNNSGAFTLQFKNNWLGSPGNNEWKTASNWSCGNIPDANTDVIINSGNIVVTENTTCRRLRVNPGATLTVNTGVTLTVLH